MRASTICTTCGGRCFFPRTTPHRDARGRRGGLEYPFRGMRRSAALNYSRRAGGGRPPRPSPALAGRQDGCRSLRHRRHIRSHGAPRPAAAVRLPRLDGALPLSRYRPGQPLARGWPAPRRRPGREVRIEAGPRRRLGRAAATMPSPGRSAWLLGAPLDLDGVLGVGGRGARPGRARNLSCGLPAATRRRIAGRCS